MSLAAQGIGSHPRLAADERARLRQIAASVGRAARLLIKQGRTALDKADLEAAGMLAVWRKLPGFDPTRSLFDRWAFYVAFRAMQDASRGEHDEGLFKAALGRGAHGYVAQDDRPAERDLHHDTPETDLRRLRSRTRRIGAAAWLEAGMENAEAGAPIERSNAATEAVQAVHQEVALLSEEQRTYLRLRFWDDTEVQEVAARMGIPERTLRRRWSETRDLLHTRLCARGILGIPDGFGVAADALALGPGEERP